MPQIHKIGGLDAFKHDLSYGASLAVGKESIMVLNGGPVMATTGSAGASLAAFGPQWGVLAGLGLTTALSAALSQMNYNYKLHSIRRLYSEELSAKLGKSVNQLKDKDLSIIAKGDPANGIEPNKTIGAALKKASKSRNIGIVLAVVASLASFAVLNLAIDAHMFEAMSGLTGTLAKMAAGVVTYNLVKIPLHWVGDRLFGLHKDNTHDRIVELEKEHEKGKAITREQVFEVFASANPELNGMIKARYGKFFEDLPPAARQQITTAFESVLPLTPMVDDLNSGKINVTELAFSAEGKASGVAPRYMPDPPEKTGLVATVKETLSKMAGHFRKPELKMPKGSVPAAAVADTAIPAGGMSHVERLMQSRSATEQLQR